MDYQEFPRMVYGPNDAILVINREEERPEGFVNHPDLLGTVEAKAAAKIAAEDAKAAEKALRAGYRDFLDRYGVDYAKNLSIEKLGELVKQLEAHLAATEAPNDDNSE